MSIEWLEELETRVREAAERLAELRDENQDLQKRVEELETKLTAATDPAEGSGELAQAREENETLRQQIAGLEQERDEIRGRVERLTGMLAGLV